MSVFTNSVLVLRLSWKWIGRGVKKYNIFQILHLISSWDQHRIKTVLNRVFVNIVLFRLTD